MATETEAKRARAKHELLDQSGAVLTGDNELEENAHGIKFTHLATGKSIEYTPSDPRAIRMLAILGAKTLATNEASQVRQKSGDSADPIPAITERFAGIENGVWVDRERQGPQWNLDAMAEAATRVLEREGKLGGKDAGTTKDALRRKIEDRKFLLQVKGVAGVMDEYNAIVGKVAPTPKTADELLTMISG